MDDQLMSLEQGVDDLRREVAGLRQDAVARLARSFKWIIATMVVAVLATWFGVFIYLTQGAERLRHLLRGL